MQIKNIVKILDQGQYEVVKKYLNFLIRSIIV